MKLIHFRVSSDKGRVVRTFCNEAVKRTATKRFDREIVNPGAHVSDLITCGGCRQIGRDYALLKVGKPPTLNRVRLFCRTTYSPNAWPKHQRSAHEQAIVPSAAPWRAAPVSSRAKKKAREGYAKLCRERVSPLSVKPWTPFERAYVDGAPELVVYRNSRYQVHVTEGTCAISDYVHLSIRLHDRVADHDWRALQRIKNELVGEEVEAVELYPAESRLVDGANQFHLWCFPAEGLRFPFGFNERLVTTDSITMPGHSASVQRPFEQEPSTRQIVIHKDGNPLNNTPENIRIENAKP